MTRRSRHAGVSAVVRVGMVAGAVLLTAGVLAQQAPQQPVFRGGANLVLVDAYPQRNGQIVEGLKPEDFQVLEDGKPQSVDSIEFVRVEPNQPEDARRDPNNLNEMKQEAGNPHNRVFVVFLDLGGITTTGSHNIRKPLVDALDRIVGPTDLFGVTTPNYRPQDLTLGRRLMSVDEQLSKYWHWGARDTVLGDQSDAGESDLTACFHYKYVKQNGAIVAIPWIVNDVSRRRFMDEVLIDRRREERTLRSLHDMVAYMPTIREARTVLLLISNGWILYRPDQLLQNELGTDERMHAVNPLPGDRPVGGMGSAPVRIGPGTGQQSDIQFSSCVTELNRLALLDDSLDFTRLLDLAGRNNVSFYPVAADGLNPFDIGGASDGSSPNTDPRTNGGMGILGENFNRLASRGSSLRTAAENTDGIAVVDTNDLSKGLRRIIDDVSAYYLLGYYSTNPKFDGKFRRIEVKMRDKNLTVHARRGYIAPTTSAAATAGTRASAAAPGTPVPATSSGGGIDVSAALGSLARLSGPAEVYAVGAVTPAGILAVVELPDRALMDAPWTGGADVTVDLTNEAGAKLGTGTGRIEPGTRGTVVKLAKPASPGPWRLSVRARAGGSSVDGRGDVATSDSPLIGAPTLYRATPSAQSALRPVADASFRRTERVHVEWPVLQPLDQRSARVVDRRGQPLPLAATLTEREVDGALAIAVDLNLGPLSEGDYVIDLLAGAGAETTHALVAFRIIR